MRSNYRNKLVSPREHDTDSIFSFFFECVHCSGLEVIKIIFYAQLS